MRNTCWVLRHFALAATLALSALACAVTVARPLPVATVVDHLCKDDQGLFACTKYSEQLPIPPALARGRAEAHGFVCAPNFCDRGELLGERPVHLVLTIEPGGVWLEIETPTAAGETTRDLLPLFATLAATTRAQLGVAAGP